MRLIIAIKDHLAVALENSSECRPECLETCRIRNDVAVVAAEVVGVNNGIGSFSIGDVVYDIGETGFVGGVDGSGHGGGDYAFH